MELAVTCDFKGVVIKTNQTLPVYFTHFLEDVVGKQLIHNHQCSTSKISYLRTDYIKLVHRARPFLDHVLNQIRALDKLIADEWVETRISGYIILDNIHGLFELKLSSGEILFSTSDQYFGRLLFSCVLQ